MPKAPKIRSRLDRLKEYQRSLAPQLGFFSTLDELVQGAPFEQAPGREWQNYLQPGRMLRRDEAQFPLKKEELEYSRPFAPEDLDQVLTKEQVLAAIRANRPEFYLTQSMPATGQSAPYLRRLEQLTGSQTSASGAHDRLATAPPKYGDARLQHRPFRESGAPPHQYEESITRMSGINLGQHFAPDTLSWGRTTSHQLPSGERMRLIEEIQSDLHQRAARQTGDWDEYLTNEEWAELTRINNERESITNRQREITGIDQLRDDFGPDVEITNDPGEAARRAEYREGVQRLIGLDEKRRAFIELGNSRRPRLGYANRPIVEPDLPPYFLLQEGSHHFLYQPTPPNASNRARRTIWGSTRGESPEQLVKNARAAGVPVPENVPLLDEEQVLRLQQHTEASEDTGMPDAPFKDPAEYAMLEMRKQLLNAANEGEDYLALTRAQDQMERYGMDEDSDADTGGMQYFYDQIYPSVLRKLGNRYGAQIEEVSLPLKVEIDLRTEAMRDFDMENVDDIDRGIWSMMNEASDLEEIELGPDALAEVVNSLDTHMGPGWGQHNGERPLIRNIREHVEDLRTLAREKFEARPPDARGVSPQMGSEWKEAVAETRASLRESLETLWNEWRAASIRENPDQVKSKTFPALRLTPEVRERIKRIGVPLFSIAGGAVVFEDEESPPAEFAKGGSVKPGRRPRTALNYLRATTDTLANQIPFISPETRAGLSDDMLRPLGGFASQWMAPDDEGNPATSSLPAIMANPLIGGLGHVLAEKLGMRRTLKPPGLITETVGLPADVVDVYNLIRGTEHEPPGLSRLAQEQTGTLREGMMDELALDEPSGFKEHALESAGIMAGQLPIGGVPSIAAKAPTWLKRAVTPLSAAVEWFSPVVDPKMGNYLQGALFGGGLGAGVEWLMNKQMEGADPEAIVSEAVRTGEISQEEGEALLRELFQQDSEFHSGEGFAKGGNVTEIMRRRGMHQLRGVEIPLDPRNQQPFARFEFEEVQGRSGKLGKIIGVHEDGTRVPVSTTSDPRLADILTRAYNNKGWLREDVEKLEFAKGGNVRPLKTALRQRLAQLLESVKPAGVQGTGQELIPTDRPMELPAAMPEPPPVETPAQRELEGLKLSRRDVLRGMASMASPIQVDPLSLLRGEDLPMVETIAPAAARTIPSLGVIARINDREGYERAAWGATADAARRALINQLAEGLETRGKKSEFEDMDQVLGSMDEFGVTYHRAGEKDKDIIESGHPFDDLMNWVRGHELHNREVRETLEGEEVDNLHDPLEDDWIRQKIEEHAEETGQTPEEVRKLVEEQLAREEDSELYFSDESWEPSEKATDRFLEIKQDPELFNDRREYDIIDLKQAYPDLDWADATDLFQLIDAHVGGADAE